MEHQEGAGTELQENPAQGVSVPPQSHLVPNVFPELGQDLVEEGQLCDQCLGLLTCQKQKGKVNPRTDKASQGCGPGLPCPLAPDSLSFSPGHTAPLFPQHTPHTLIPHGALGQAVQGFLPPWSPKCLTPGNVGSRTGTYPGWRPAHSSLQGERRDITKCCCHTPAASPHMDTPGQHMCSTVAPTYVGTLGQEGQEQPSVLSPSTSLCHSLHR